MDIAVPKRQSVDFDGMKPPDTVTDPNHVGADKLFPRQLYRFVSEQADAAMVVAWHRKEPIYNECVVVTSDVEQAAKLADGYALEPQMKPAERKKDKAAA